MKNKLLAGIVGVFTLILTNISVQAALTDDLNMLVNEGTFLQEELTSFTFNQAQSCTGLGVLNSSIEDYLNNVESVTDGLGSSLTLTAGDLTSLDALSALAKSMASRAVNLSWELLSIEDMAELFEYRAGLSAMLRLSDDIGKMANRILEMADRILLMADNIGQMADRILYTQQLQNSNVALTQAAILTTQQNIVILSDSISTIAYNLTLNQIDIEANGLLHEMEAMALTEENMAEELDRLATRNALLLDKTVNLVTLVVGISQSASHAINGDSLTSLGDLSEIHRALAFSLENYAAAMGELAPLTDTPILEDATASMLRLTGDIGLMANRIMEMTDKIIVMADNMGIMADRIVETQNLQLANVELTQNSLLSAQNTTITVMKNMLGQ